MRQTQRVRALGLESRGAGCGEGRKKLHLDSSVYLDLPRRPAASISPGSNADGTSPARPFGDWEVGIPVGLAVGASPSGLPDLRIELVRVRWGSSTRLGSRRACINRNGVSGGISAAANGDCGGTHHLVTLAPATRSDSSYDDNEDTSTGIIAGDTSSLPYGASFNSSASRRGCRTVAVLPYLSTAGALLLGTVLFTDAAAAVRPHLVVPGLCVGAAMAAAAGAECVWRHAEARRGLQPGEGVICSQPGGGIIRSEGDGGGGGGRALHGARAAWRAARGLARAAGRSGRPAVELLQRVLVPSALLSLAADTWHVAHASSAALADALLGLAAAALSYKRLGRDIADGRIPPGHAQELAWRRCHKAVARRLARHLGDLPASPPMRAALEAWERCGIAAGLAVDGAPLCGVVDSLAICRTAAAAAGGGGNTGSCGSAGGAGVQAGGGATAGWGRRAEGGQLVLSFSYRGRRKQGKQCDGARGVHEEAKTKPQGGAGTVPGAPAGPLNGAPVETAVTEAAAARRTLPGQLNPQNKTSPRPLTPPRSIIQLPQQQQQQREQQTDSPAPGTLQGMPSSSLQRGLPRAASASSLKLMDAAAVPVGGATAAAAGRAGVAAGGAGPEGSSSPGCDASPARTPTTRVSCPPLPAASLASAAAAATGTAGAGQQGAARATPSPAPLAPVPSSPAPQPVQATTAAGANLPAAPTAITAADWDVHRMSPARAAQLMAAEQAAVEALGLPLYGRADHAYGTQDAVLRAGGQLAYLSYRLGLACRAVYLMAVFAPFCTLGVGLLLLSSLLARWAATGTSKSSSSPRTRASVSVEANSRAGQPLAAANSRATPPAVAADSATATVTRPGTAADAAAVADAAGGTCTALSSTSPIPPVGPPTATVTTPSSSSWGDRAALRCRRAAWSLLLGGCRRSGAAFIKWGQWAATRVDLFPDDFCVALGSLHDSAPTHSFAFTRRQVESAFGCALESLFESFDPRPVASGSIAQVHRALLRSPDGCRLLEVAVKVVHPRVALRIRQDFALLRPAAVALGRLPSLRQLSLPETVAQFSSTMTAQADLRVEAAHLRRFYANFAQVAHKVLTPRPLPGMVRPEVMVETWEAGRSVSHYIRQPSPVNSTVVCLGVDTYLKMLLADNFVHTDLHPGNIMVRLVDERGRPVGLPGEAPPLPPPNPSASAAVNSHDGTGSRLRGGACSGGSGAAAAVGGSGSGGGGGSAAEAGVQLVLLDFGLAEELTPAVRHHFISFLHHLLAGNGVAAARHLLQWTERPQACPDPPALTADMVRLAAERCDVHSPQGIDLDAVMKDVLRLARRHRVTIDSCYAALVISVCVIVGFAASMDPRVNLVDPAVPAMLMHALTGRVIGRLHSN